MQGGLQRAYLLCLNMFTEIPPSVKFLRSIKLHFTKCSQRLTLIYRVQRTTHQGIGLRDTCYDPGEMFSPPRKELCAPIPRTKIVKHLTEPTFCFRVTSLRDPIELSLTLARQASETRANSAKTVILSRNNVRTSSKDGKR